MKLDEEFIKEDDTWYKMIQNDLWDIGKYRIPLSSGSQISASL